MFNKIMDMTKLWMIIGIISAVISLFVGTWAAYLAYFENNGAEIIASAMCFFAVFINSLSAYTRWKTWKKED